METIKDAKLQIVNRVYPDKAKIHDHTFFFYFSGKDARGSKGKV